MTTQEEFDLSSLFDTNADDWPYNGARIVVLDGVKAQAHDRFGNVYDDTGKRINYLEAKNYDKENLPVGYEYHPNVDLVLSMAVEDQGLPEPQYPPRIPLGDTRTIRVNDDGSFQFISSSGEVRNPQSNSWFATFVKALGELGFAKLATTQFVNTGTKTWNPSALNGLALVFDGAKVTREGAKEPKVRAWPVGVAGSDANAAPAAAAAPAPEANEDLTALATSDITDDEFREAALKLTLDPNTALGLVQNPKEFRASLVAAS